MDDESFPRGSWQARGCKTHYKTLCKATDLDDDIESNFINSNVTDYLRKREVMDEQFLTGLMTQMNDVASDFNLDTPPDWFTRRMGLPTTSDEETAECISRIQSLKRKMWDEFRSYGSWGKKIDHAATTFNAKRERTFRILEGLNSFGLWLAQPLMDEPAHGPLQTSNQTFRTPHLWAGFNSQCRNKDGRTTKEDLESFQVLTNSYALDAGTHLAEVLKEEEVMFLQECSWHVKQVFWGMQSMDFMRGLPSQGIETVFISLNKRHLKGDFGLQNSTLWQIQLPALAQIYGQSSAMHEGKAWKPALEIFDMKQSCKLTGGAVAKRLQGLLRKKNKTAIHVECRECADTLRHCLGQQAKPFRYNAAKQIMEVDEEEDDLPSHDDVTAARADPAGSAETAVRTMREQTALSMTKQDMQDPNQTARVEAGNFSVAAQSDDDGNRQCSDRPDLDMSGRLLVNQETKRCPDQSHPNGKGNCTCEEDKVFSGRCGEYVLLNTMPETSRVQIACQCVPDPRMPVYLKTHVAAMEFCSELVQAVYKTHQRPKFSNSIQKAAEEVERHLKIAVAEKACQAALSKAEATNNSVDQILHGVAADRIPDPAGGHRAQAELAQGAALALQHVCRDECHSLVQRMTNESSEDSSLLRLAERSATGRPLQEQCAKTVVQKVEGELLGCCARSCGWTGTRCSLWNYMDEEDQFEWKAECCTEYNILRNSSREKMCNSMLSQEKVAKMARHDTEQLAKGDAEKVGQDAEVVEDGGSGLLEVPQKQVCHVKAKKCPKDNIVRHWRACAKKTGFKFLASTGDVLMGQLSGVKQSLEDCAKDKKGTEALLWRSSTGKCYKVADVNKKDIMQTLWEMNMGKGNSVDLVWLLDHVPSADHALQRRAGKAKHYWPELVSSVEGEVTTLGGSALPSAGELPAAQASTYTPGTYGGVTYTPGTAYTPGTTSAGTAPAYMPPAYSSYSTPTIAGGGAAYTSTSSPYGAYTGAYTPSTYASALPAYGNTYGGYYGSAPVTGSSYAAAPATEMPAATYGTPAMAAATAYGNGSFTAAPSLGFSAVESERSRGFLGLCWVCVGVLDKSVLPARPA
ncbi:unnamed protein product [Symbiodinium sp. KB8]|nr:unnamed protein product [Symbiodinium sp. KB8]